MCWTFRRYRKWCRKEQCENRCICWPALLSATAEQKIKSAWETEYGRFTRHSWNGERRKVSIVLAKFHRCFWSFHTESKYTSIYNYGTHYCLRDKQVGRRKMVWILFSRNSGGCTQHPVTGLIGYKTETGWKSDGLRCSYFHEAQNQNLRVFFPRILHCRWCTCTMHWMQPSDWWMTLHVWKFRSSYNIASMGFTPKQLSKKFVNTYPDFTITYKPDVRQQYADSWPKASMIQSRVPTGGGNMNTIWQKWQGHTGAHSTNARTDSIKIIEITFIHFIKCIHF